MSAPPLQQQRTTSLASIGSLKSFTSPKALNHYIFPLFILGAIVCASASQTESAHYVTYTADYNQPYFMFWMTHSTFTWVFPLHLLFLAIFRRQPISEYFDGLRALLAVQFGEEEESPWQSFLGKFVWKITWLTVLISVSAITWFIAVVYTSAMDVTTIYATSSFHTYFFSMLLLKQPLSKITIGSIFLAFAGVIVISMAGGGSGDAEGEVRNRLLGDVTMMAGAILLGLYEVVYKLALPEGHGGVAVKTPHSAHYARLPVHADPANPPSEFTPPESRTESPPPDSATHKTPLTRLYSTPRRPDTFPMTPSGLDRLNSTTPLLKTLPSSPPPTDDSPEYRPPPIARLPSGNVERHALPQALHANFITSCIGLMTISLLAIPIPLLHFLGIETFRWPGTIAAEYSSIWACLGVITWGGAIYNAGLMILIGVWGPTTSSVANLLTIALVGVIDSIRLGHLPDVLTMIGAGMICVGFSVLLWEGEE